MASDIRANLFAHINTNIQTKPENLDRCPVLTRESSLVSTGVLERAQVVIYYWKLGLALKLFKGQMNYDREVKF